MRIMCVYFDFYYVVFVCKCNVVLYLKVGGGDLLKKSSKKIYIIKNLNKK